VREALHQNEIHDLCKSYITHEAGHSRTDVYLRDERLFITTQDSFRPRDQYILEYRY